MRREYIQGSEYGHPRDPRRVSFCRSEMTSKQAGKERARDMQQVSSEEIGHLACRKKQLGKFSAVNTIGTVCKTV